MIVGVIDPLLLLFCVMGALCGWLLRAYLNERRAHARTQRRYAASQRRLQHCRSMLARKDYWLTMWRWFAEHEQSRANDFCARLDAAGLLRTGNPSKN